MKRFVLPTPLDTEPAHLLRINTLVVYRYNALIHAVGRLPTATFLALIYRAEKL